ncbi:MAG: EAL domain-containing protein [Rubrobacter sp.]|nr:EAL domain-containing protein [Rubrobacter sp.]
MNAWAMEQMILGNDLKRALGREEFTLLYQPKILLSTGRIFGVEALLYWNHPERGRLSPGQFIPLAEETGMISEIGRWVLREACRRTRLWKDSLAHPPASVSVNLSVVQLRSKKLVEDVADALAESGLAPDSLSLEITESLLMENVYSAIDTLTELRGLGVGLDMDDFGTGYSSLATLKNLPLDTLKVDKAFVDGLREGGRDTDIVRAVIGLAHTLGMSVTA